MANNKVYKPGWQLALPVDVPVAPNSGDPVIIGEMTGVALTDINGATGLTVVDLGPGVWRLEVTETLGPGIAVGDPIYITAGGVLNDVAGGTFFGYALEAVGAGLTATIEVLHPQSAGA